MSTILTRKHLLTRYRNTPIEEIQFDYFGASSKFFETSNIILFEDGSNIKILKDQYNVFGRKDVEKQVVQAEYFKDRFNSYIGYKILKFYDGQSLVYIPAESTGDVDCYSLSDNNNILSEKTWVNSGLSPSEYICGLKNNYIFKTDNLIDPKIKEAMDLLEKNGYSVNKVE